MNVILGGIAALRQDRLSRIATERAIDAIERNAAMLDRLVDDVLDRSRMVTDTRTTLVGRNAQVTVADTGSGIKAEFLPHVFDAFRQDHRTLQHSSRGLGLGLSISKNLVERHGGTITATSQGRGRGSAFTVSLPLTAHREAEPAAVDVTHAGAFGR
jgi:signal transduction histidine kinase